MFKVFVAMEEDEEGQTSQEEQRDDQNIESSINVIWDVTHGIINDDDEEEKYLKKFVFLKPEVKVSLPLLKHNYSSPPKKCFFK
jgi:hypothetical protein